MAHVALPPRRHPDPEVRETYAEIEARYGVVPSFLRVLGHTPALLFTTWDCYAPTMVAGMLDRGQRELVALTIARAHGADERASFHRRTLRALGYNTRQIDEITDLGRPSPARHRRERALCAYAERLVREPSQLDPADRSDLRALGWCHTEIVEAAAVAIWGTLFDRLALALDLPPEVVDPVGPVARARARASRARLAIRLRSFRHDLSAERSPGTIENWMRKEDTQRGGRGRLPPPLVPVASVPAAIASLGPLARRLADGHGLSPSLRRALVRGVVEARPGLLPLDWLERWIHGSEPTEDPTPLSASVQALLTAVASEAGALDESILRAARQELGGDADLIEALYVIVAADVLRSTAALAEPPPLPGARLPGLSGYPSR